MIRILAAVRLRGMAGVPAQAQMRPGVLEANQHDRFGSGPKDIVELFPKFRAMRGLATAFLVVATLVTTNPSRADELKVSRASFAGGIQDREAAPALAPGQKAAPGPLWFWTEIHVPVSLLSELREKKLLPLQHRWYRSYGGMPAPDQKPDFFRNLEEFDESKLSKLEAEAHARSFFTYRTASCRKSLAPGTWVTAVTDRLGNSLPCPGRTACRFVVQVSSDGAKSPTRCTGG